MYCSYQFYEELGLFEDQRYQRLVETSASFNIKILNVNWIFLPNVCNTRIEN
jgi:hypothetical protein